MLILLAFAHFSSELLFKEPMIIPVKKTLNNAGHIDAKLIDFSEICQKNPAKSAVFYWLFLGEVSPRNFPWNRPIFLRICPWKSFEIWLFLLKSREIGRFFCEIWLFSRENSAKSADFSANIDFFPRKSREIGRFFCDFAPENPAKFCFFFREISETLPRLWGKQFHYSLSGEKHTKMWQRDLCRWSTMNDPCLKTSSDAIK